MEIAYVIVFLVLAIVIGSSGLSDNDHPKPIIIQFDRDSNYHRRTPSNVPVMILLLLVLISIIVSS